MLVLFVVTIFGPVVFWFWLFAWLDRAEPEPKQLLLKVFLLGAILAVVVSGIEQLLWQLAFGQHNASFNVQSVMSGNFTVPLFLLLVGAAVIEEFCKFWLLKEYIYDNVNFNQIADGVFYGVTLALGFAMVENISYFLSIGALHNRSLLIGASIIRALFSMTLHIMATGISGLALGRKKFRPQHPMTLVYKGLALAMVLHATYNLLTQFGGLGILVIIGVLGWALSYIISAVRQQESKLVWRLIVPKPDI